MTPTRLRGAATTTVAAALALLTAVAIGTSCGAQAAPSSTGPAVGPTSPSRHVLLLSVDGLHQSDLTWFVRRHPHSAMARLVGRGTSYSSATTTFPSDSFPGMIAQLTGADPGTAGVYYDDTFNPDFFPPGTTDCSGPAPGSEIPWTEAADRSQDPITLDAGQGLTDPSLTSLPSNTLQQTLADASAISRAIGGLTPDPQTLLDPAALPVDPSTCAPTYPHQYLRVNTVFDVVHAAGGRTAWSDKHPAYEILDGPSGDGIDDLFTPEINSVADAAGDDWTQDNLLTREYDGFKVDAVLHEIDGLDHSGTTQVGTPAVFGMNFQSVSTAQKLPTSDGLVGGYRPDGTPGPLLSAALRSVDGQIRSMLARIHDDGLAASTTVILSAKHGQSPIDPTRLRRVDDGPIIDGLNAAWSARHPGGAGLASFAVDDDVMLLWLSDHSPAALRFARHYLLSHDAPANTVHDPAGVFSTTVAHSGLTGVVTGGAVDRLVDAPSGDPHAPDLVGLVQHGVVYTGGTKKIAEHGGDSSDDRSVPLVVSGAGAPAGTAVTRSVTTTQIAPTILHLLGLDPDQLQGVQEDRTQVLPGL